MNGDSFFNIDLMKLINYHFNKKALATMALVKVKDTTRYGTVEISKNGEIERFIEKEDNSNSNLINGGIYILNKAIFNYIIKDNKISLEKDIFPNLIGKEFYGIYFNNYFIDIGVPEDYKRLKKSPHIFLKLYNCEIENINYEE